MRLALTWLVSVSLGIGCASGRPSVAAGAASPTLAVPAPSETEDQEATVEERRSSAQPAWAPFDRSRLADTVEPCVNRPGRYIECIARVPTGHRPKSLSFSPDGRELWVALHYDRPAVAVYDTATWALIGAVDLGRYGAVELAFSADGSRVFASQLETATVHEMDRTRRKVVRVLRTGSKESKVIEVAADGRTLWVSNWKGRDVTEFDLTTGERRRSLRTRGIPRGLFATVDGEALYVAGFSPGRLYRFDLATGRRTVVTERGGVHRHLVADERRGRLYISDLSASRIWVLDLESGAFEHLARVDRRPNTIDLTPDGRILLVSNRGKDHPEGYLNIGPQWGSILAVDALTGRLLDAVITGNQSTGLAVSPDGRLVANSDFLDNRINVYQLPASQVLLEGDGGRAAGRRRYLRKRSRSWGRKAKRNRRFFDRLHQRDAGAERGPLAPASAEPDSGLSRRSLRAREVAAHPRGFNQVVLELVDAYDTGGGYSWPAPRGTHGTTRDLFLGERRIARGTGRRGTHCSGLTFEVFWRALQAWPGGVTASGLDAAGARALMREWFVPRQRGQGPASALTAHGLGRRIVELEDARPGDFLQFWTRRNRGHTAVFLGWVRDRRGRIVGSRHWSSHPRTGGIGIRERRIGRRPNDIDRDYLFIGRATPPIASAEGAVSNP